MKKVINILLVSFLIGSMLRANETEIFVKGEKQEQDKPHTAQGIAKIVSGVVVGAVGLCLLSPGRLIRNIHGECTQLCYGTKIENESHRNYKKIVLNGLGIALYSVPIYLIVDGLNDLHVFKKIKERIGCLSKTLKIKT